MKCVDVLPRHDIEKEDLYEGLIKKEHVVRILEAMYLQRSFERWCDTSTARNSCRSRGTNSAARPISA